MPRATVSRDTERFDLKTLPEGYVVIRRMTFGEKLQRQDDLLQMRAGTGNEVQFNMLNKKAALADFGNLVIEHNLEDDSGRLLNFKVAQDVLQLDPRVGEEISALIDSINAFEEDQDVKNS